MSDSSPEGVAQRLEGKLVGTYLHYRRSKGLPELRRLRIKPAGEAQFLYSDLYDAEENTIIEAKAFVTRESLRMAVGQLLDYARFLSPRPKLAVLLPHHPRSDLSDYLHQAGISPIICDVAADEWS